MRKAFGNQQGLEISAVDLLIWLPDYLHAAYAIMVDVRIISWFNP
jgi:hypothetical protein